MCNATRESSIICPYRLTSKMLRAFSMFIFIILTPLWAMANGAAGVSGFNGNEISVTESQPFKQFIVDEEVILDFNTERVTVKYDIENTSSMPRIFKMLFPIESSHESYLKCSNFPSSEARKSLTLDEFIDFKVHLNNVSLPVKAQDPSSIIPEGEYNKLKKLNREKICSFKSFDVRIGPGKNSLLIDYHLVPDWTMSDSIGESYRFTYSIWPAKNWVSKFRNAVWRVVIPRYRQNLIYQFDNWYMNDPKRASNHKRYWSKWALDVTGPGTRKEMGEYIEFTATDFAPNGEVTVKYALYDFYHIVRSSSLIEADDSIDRWLQAYLTLHPYIGDKMCYEFEDLRSSWGYMGFGFDSKDLPYLRNEIYARKGYIFKSHSLKSFFSKLQWYSPTNQDVKLNEIEEWNVKFIAAVEKSAKSCCPNDEYGQELEERVMKNRRSPCPDNIIK